MVSFCQASVQTDKSIRCKSQYGIDEEGNCQQEGKNTSKQEELTQVDFQRGAIERRLHPNCKEDVKILFAELELWRNQKLDKIEQERDISSEKRIKLRSNVLDTETILLRKINKINKKLTSTIQKRQMNEAFDRITSPKYWELSNGKSIEIQTPASEKSSELIQIYKSLANSGQDETVVQRLKILEYAKSKLHSRSCKFAKEIFCLLDREEELLNRGIKQSLAGLRLRISNLFLAHIERNLDGLR